jgi:hypothetical protein
MHYIAHTFSKLSHHSGKTADTTEQTDHARKSHSKNIKENFYIYSYKHSNQLVLVYEQNIDDINKNILFNKVTAYIDKPL